MEEIQEYKFDPLKNFLFFLFSLDERYKNKKKLMENVQILIDEQELKKDIEKQWIYLLGNSENYDNLVDEFVKKSYTEWSKRLETFQNIKNDLEIKGFIEDNFPLSMLIRFETGNLSRDEILRFLELKEPKIKDFYQGSYGKYLNFLIYDKGSLYINLHLKLKEFTTETYGLLVIISFWIEEPEFYDTIDLNIINGNYSSSILCYKILNKLLSLGFKKFSLFDVSEYWKEKYYPKIKNEWAKSLPYLFITAGMEIINENPTFLFEELTSKLNQLELIIKDHGKSSILNPNDWYNSLSVEVQTFIEKGKELFLNIEEKYQEIEKGKTVEEVRIKEPKENALTIEDIVLLFKDILQTDKQDEKIDDESKGFRTINSFFKECKNNLKGKSMQTLYNYFKQWKNLDYYLESRESRHQGGGKEYRYREGLMSYDNLPKNFIETIDERKESFQKEKIQIQQALNYYNNQKYKKAQAILLKISKNPSEDLIKDNQLYYGTFYYIGRCYQKLYDSPNANNYFKKIYSENKDFINVDYHYIETSLEEGNFEETFQIIDQTLKKLKELLKIFDLVNYYKIYDDLSYTIGLKSMGYNSIYDALRPYIEYLESNDFKKYIIGINKVRSDLIIIRKPFDEKDYTMIYHNFKLTERFYNTLLRIWFLKSECFRRYLYINIINENTDILNENFNNMINFFKEIQQLNSKSQIPFLSILSFVNYFIGLTKLFDLTMIRNLLEENFPEVKDLHFSPEFNFLKKYNEIYLYLNAVNKSFNNPKGIFQYEVRRLMSFEFNPREKSQDIFSLSPEIEAEFLFIKISLLEKYVLNDLMNEENAFIENIKGNDTDNIGEIFKNWEDFHFPFHYYKNLINYNRLFSEFEEICQNYKLEIYKGWIKKLKKVIFAQLTKIRKVRNNGRNYALDRIFRLLHSKYSLKTHEFEINMEEKPEDLSVEYYIYDFIHSEIKSIIKEGYGKIRAKLDLKNKELAKHVINSVNEHGLFIGSDLDLDFNLWLELEFISEENGDFIEIYYRISLTYETVRFEECLDIIPLALFQIIKMNADELLIQISEKFHNDFKTYFEDQFLKEYQNDFFEFSVINELDKNRFRIKIKKL